ncbi:MAG: glycosyltransferase family 2 protein [Hyphomonadaceae bacterium]
MAATPFPSPDMRQPDAASDTVRRDVTIVIAAWRAAGTIGRAVASALAQPEAAEVVVVDDASGDGCATVTAALEADDGSGRLKVFALPRNSGPSAARNAAIRASKAAWIAVLDSDDFMQPGRLGKLLPMAGLGYDLLADDLLQVPDGHPASDGKPLWFRDDQTPVDINFGFFIDSNVTRASRMRRELGFLKPLVRRAFLEEHGLVYDETMRLGEDYDLYARALSLGAKMRLVPWTGYVSVMRGNSLSLNHGRDDLAALEESDDRLLASGRLSVSEAKLVRKHRFTTRSRIVWIDFMARLKRKNLFGAAGVVLKDVRQAPYVMRGLGKIVTKRLGLGQRT